MLKQSEILPSFFSAIIPQAEDLKKNKDALVASYKVNGSTKAQLVKAEEDLLTAQNGLDGWKRAIKIDTDKKTSTDWFQSNAIEPLVIKDDSMWTVLFQGMERTANIFSSFPIPGIDTSEASYKNKAGNVPDALSESKLDKAGKLRITDQSSGLAPQTLINNAQSLGFTYGKSSKTKNLDDTRRIQFSGASGTYEMSMTKSRAEGFSSNSCYMGCNFEVGLGVAGDIEVTGTAFGVGLSAQLSTGEMIKFVLNGFEIMHMLQN